MLFIFSTIVVITSFSFFFFENGKVFYSFRLIFFEFIEPNHIKMYIEVGVSNKFDIIKSTWNTKYSRHKVKASFRKDRKIGRTYHNIPDRQITFLL